MDKLVKVTVYGRPISLSNSVKAFGHHGPIMMSTDDIFKCLVSDASVVEVNGKEELLLNLANYKTENFKKVVVPKVPEAKPTVEIKPLPNATPGMIEDVLIPNATPEMDGGVKTLDAIKEIVDYVKENEELSEEIEASISEEESLLFLKETPITAELNNVEPTAPAIEAIDDTIASDFIPKVDDKPNRQPNNRYNHGKNKNRR